MTEQTRYQTYEVPESELLEWYEREWSYVGPAERDGYCVIMWEHDRPISAPFRGEDELAHIHGGASLEAVA